MDSSQSDADKIRAKRLAKLGGQNASTTPSAAIQNGTEPSLQPAESLSHPPQTPLQKPATPQPSSQPQVEQKPSAPQISAKPRPTSPAKRERDGSERIRSAGAERAPEAMKTWQDRNLRQIFRVTLKAEEIRDAHGNQLIFLPSTKEDLNDQALPSLLDLDVLEGAITEAAGKSPGGKVFEYLLQCFKRVSRSIRGLRHNGDDDPKLEVLKETRRLCMSYCIFAVTMPEMFGADSTSNPLVDHLLADPECEVGICTDFLTEASARSDEDESIKEAVVSAAEELSRQLAGVDMNGDYQKYVRAMRSLLRFPKLVDAITLSPMFVPKDIEAQDIETKTLLGPYFRLSPMQQMVACNYFPNPQTSNRGLIAQAQNAVRLTLRTHQSELFDIANGIVRTGAVQRERMLDWFALCVNKNHKKRAMRVDYKIVSSDGFMVNVTNVLDQLCDPFMDATFSKIQKIDVGYLRRNPRVDISDETKINADQKTADDFYLHKAEGTSNFISEVFFLTVAAHHYGTEAAQDRMGSLRKSIKRMEQDVAAMERERPKYAHDPRYLARFEEQLAKAKKYIDDSWSYIHATQGVLVDDINQSRSMQFMRYVIVWLLALASRQRVPEESLNLPLSVEQPEVFRCLPEYFLEDIVENFKFITSHIPHIITPQQCDEIVQVCVTFLRNTEYIKNAGVKSGLVSILFYGVQPFGAQRRGVLTDKLIGSPFAHKHLLHALMKFYIEAEQTGTNTQFYDKFNIRYEIFQVIKCIWINTMYRDNLQKEAQVNTDFFVQFVNMLVNDFTYVLDESLGSMNKIHDLSKEIADADAMRDLTDEQKKEKQDLLEEHKGRAKNYMQLTKETMESLILFTEALPEAFTMREIVTRLADMLDYNLDTLVGPKRSNVKVETPADYGFQPFQLLADILSVYINLAAQPRFVEAIAKDARSYKPANFAEATRLMRLRATKSPEELRAWEELGTRVAAQKARDDQDADDFGDAPDEFYDPLLAELMEDPVILPRSRETVDRATIRSHLLSDPTDPFNRTPLSLDDVVPNTDLKRRIDEWKAEKRAQRAAANHTVATVGDGADRMDTSAG